MPPGEVAVLARITWLSHGVVSLIRLRTWRSDSPTARAICWIVSPWPRRRRISASRSWRRIATGTYTRQPPHIDTRV